jgi:RNA polymerase sigma factor (sigma-70 family)
MAEPIDLLATGDEKLIALFRDGSCPEARDELILRYLRWTRRGITVQAYKAGLNPSFLPDAQQIAGMALLEAIDKFDTEHKPASSSFQTFLWHVITNRFRDFLKRTRRAESRYKRSSTSAVKEKKARGAAAIDNEGFLFIDEKGDPARLAEEQEQMDRLADAINALSTTKHLIWIRVLAGAKITAIAEELGISYDATRRRLRKTVDVLRRQVKGREKP